MGDAERLYHCMHVLISLKQLFIDDRMTLIEDEKGQPKRGCRWIQSTAQKLSRPPKIVLLLSIFQNEYVDHSKILGSWSI